MLTKRHRRLSTRCVKCYGMEVRPMISHRWNNGLRMFFHFSSTSRYSHSIPTRRIRWVTLRSLKWWKGNCYFIQFSKLPVIVGYTIHSNARSNSLLYCLSITIFHKVIRWPLNEVKDMTDCRRFIGQCLIKAIDSGVEWPLNNIS